MSRENLNHLIHLLLDGSLSESQREELNRDLKRSPAARAEYRKAIALHGMLIRKCDPSQASFPIAGALTVVPEETAAAPRPVLMRNLIAATALAASIALVAALFHRSAQPRATVLKGDFKTPPGSPLLPHGSAPIHTPLEILSGSVTLKYPSGAAVTLEAPCRFRIDGKESISIGHGSAFVHAPPGAEGFVLNTPGGEFIDLGTRFGVGVGSDGENSVILTEVFEGEIDVKFSKSGTTRLASGESGAIVRDGGMMQLVSRLDASPIHLTRSHPAATGGSPNLALGKPVYSPAYCVRANGSVFPPDNLTDGRLNDSGVPGDWSFWLSPDLENGEFTVDLLEQTEISRVSLQNTCNRFIDDRGTRDFMILTSADNKEFTPAIEGSLPRIDRTETLGSFPFHDFAFPPVKARYVKFVAISHYKHPSYPRHPMHSAGLNEIRIFE